MINSICNSNVQYALLSCALHVVRTPDTFLYAYYTFTDTCLTYCFYREPCTHVVYIFLLYSIEPIERSLIHFFFFTLVIWLM